MLWRCLALCAVQGQETPSTAGPAVKHSHSFTHLSPRSTGNGSFHSCFDIEKFEVEKKIIFP